MIILFLIITMKSFILSFSLLLTGLFLSACTPSPTTTSNPIQTPQTETPAPVFDENQDYIGLTESEAMTLASEKNESFRIIMRDGEPQPATMDYRPGRINASLENGMIVDYTIEGSEDISEKTPVSSFNQDSWKTLIDESCSSFFDGCNTCRKESGSDGAACTRMFCETYEEPRCLDDENTENL